jgi:uncharacterized protein YndB with AHSA1/START domain
MSEQSPTSERNAEAPVDEIVLEVDLDAPPEKVWRAISIPDYRERWLPETGLADVEPLSSSPGETITYRVRDEEPPHLESLVTFELSPGADGGSRLRIVHRLADARLMPSPPAANDNEAALMCAA